jgi:hypothetical protein
LMSIRIEKSFSVNFAQQAAQQASQQAAASWASSNTPAGTPIADQHATSYEPYQAQKPPSGMQTTDVGPLMGGAYRPPPPPTQHVHDPYAGPTTTEYDESGRPIPVQTMKPLAPHMPGAQYPPLSQDVQQFLDAGKSRTPLWDKYHTVDPSAVFGQTPQTEQQQPPPPDMQQPPSADYGQPPQTQ